MEHIHTETAGHPRGRRRHGGFPHDSGRRGSTRGGPRGRRHGGRGRRGDIRTAILILLAEQPRHGYEIIGEISERSSGLWRPSPGSIYPTLQLLADEGLVTSTEQDGKRQFELTDAGRTAAEDLGIPPWESIARDTDPVELELRTAASALTSAMRQTATAGTDTQKAKAVAVLNDARRSLYAILGDIEQN